MATTACQAFLIPAVLQSVRFRPGLSGAPRTTTTTWTYRPSTTRMMTTARRQSADELVRDVLTHWFGSTEVGRYDSLDGQAKVWYEGGKEVDADIRNRFGADVESALQGEWDNLIGNSEYPMTGPLAMVIMLDQYTRNIFRGSAKAFAGDEKCIEVALAIVKGSCWPRAKEQLSAPQLMSFLLPFMHQESMLHLDTCVDKICELMNDSKAAGEKADKVTKLLESNLGYAQKHRDIVQKFGRYPHRNDVLGRASTLEELKFLDGGPRFGQ